MYDQRFVLLFMSPFSIPQEDLHEPGAYHPQERERVAADGALSRCCDVACVVHAAVAGGSLAGRSVPDSPAADILLPAITQPQVHSHVARISKTRPNV